MPTYPTYDGRMPLTRAAMNDLTAQAQAGSRRNSSEGMTIAGNALTRAAGRFADGGWVRLLEARTVTEDDREVTYYAFREQPRRPNGSWGDDPDGGPVVDGKVNPAIETPAVEKMNRPGPLGDIVFLSRAEPHPDIGLLYLFESTLGGIWADVAWDDDSETYSFTQITPPDWLPTPFGFSGPPEDPEPDDIVHTVREKADTPGRPGRYWLVPGPADGFNQPWAFDAYGRPSAAWELAWCDVVIDVVAQTVTFSDPQGSPRVTFDPAGSFSFTQTPEQYGFGLSAGNANPITQSPTADGLVTVTAGPFVREALLPGLANVVANQYTIDVQGSLADTPPVGVTFTVSTQWLTRLAGTTPASLTLVGRLWVDFQ